MSEYVANPPQAPAEGSEEILFELPQTPFSEERVDGHWETRNPDKQYLTHASHLGKIAGHLTDAHPDGWRFIVDRADRRKGKVGHIEYFVRDET